jgi:hypothetical protein
VHAKVADVPPYYFPATVRAGLPERSVTPLRPLPQDGEAEVSTLSQRLSSPSGSRPSIPIGRAKSEAGRDWAWQPEGA